MQEDNSGSFAHWKLPSYLGEIVKTWVAEIWSAPFCLFCKCIDLVCDGCDKHQAGLEVWQIELVLQSKQWVSYPLSMV